MLAVLLVPLLPLLFPLLWARVVGLCGQDENSPPIPCFTPLNGATNGEGVISVDEAAIVEEDDSDEYDATEIVITWNGVDYSLKYQKNSSTFGQQYQLFQENQTNPAGFLYALKSYDENGYENEYILLYLEDRSYFYIGKLDWKHDFYALYL